MPLNLSGPCYILIHLRIFHASLQALKSNGLMNLGYFLIGCSTFIGSGLAQQEKNMDINNHSFNRYDSLLSFV